MNISAPWYTYYRKLSALFIKDKEIHIEFDDEERVITMFITSYEKAEALKKILPKEVEFGGLILKINIVYKEILRTPQEIYEAAFKNNPAFKYTYEYEMADNAITYVVFEKEVVQYWNDDLSDPHGITSTLYQDVAKDIFKNNTGAYFSTYSDKDKERISEWEKTHATKEEIKLWEKYNGKGSYFDLKDKNGVCDHAFAFKEIIDKAKKNK